MADTTALRIIGFIAASITGAVILIAVLLVHKTGADALALDQPPATLSAH